MSSLIYTIHHKSYGLRLRVLYSHGLCSIFSVFFTSFCSSAAEPTAPKKLDLANNFCAHRDLFVQIKPIREYQHISSLYRLGRIGKIDNGSSKTIRFSLIDRNKQKRAHEFDISYMHALLTIARSSVAQVILKCK